jgi:hypothetical protein
MGRAQPTHHGPTSAEQGADPQLAEALDRLLDALDGFPPGAGDANALPQESPSYGGGGVLPRREVHHVLHMLGLRLRYSHRLRYRLLRLVFVWLLVVCVSTGVALILSWLLTAP